MYDLEITEWIAVLGLTAHPAIVSRAQEPMQSKVECEFLTVLYRMPCRQDERYF